MARMFGTDGVRGIANEGLTPETAFMLGQAGAYVLTSKAKRARIIVARDTRISGDMLECALVAGMTSVGADALCLGIMPTPSVAFLVRHYKADAGVMISASHNPFCDNGIKFFSGDGYKLPDEIEDRIEEIIRNKTALPRATGENIGRRVFLDEAAEVYKSYLKNMLKLDLKGLKIAVDCSNGSNYKIAPSLLKEMGADVLTINHEPDGVNINANCGSTHIDALRKYVPETGADLGLAFDGDADRLICVDENGDTVDGDKAMVMCAIHMKKNGLLKNNTVVVTVMSNLGLTIALNNNGINVVKTKVGDRYVLEEMLKNDYVIGGEQSGHIIFLDYNTTGDGLISALNVLKVMTDTGKKLSDLAGVMTQYPQVLVNAKVNQVKKYDYKNDEVIVSKIAELENKFSGEGRVLIRPSGTEALVRVMIEGKDQKLLEKEAVNLKDILETRLK